MNSENTDPDGTRSGDDDSRIIPIEYIERRIYLMREQKVMLDSDLANLYRVTTGNLNLAVRRNQPRFPTDFMFQLTKEEGASLLLQSAIAKKGRGGRQTPPYVFTELGVAMLSSVLNSERAVQINILIMRAFVRLRTLLATSKELARRLDEIETRFNKELSRHDQKLATHEQAITGIFKTLRDLMNPPQIRAIGFTADLSKNP
jgi:ORF6N domain